MQLHPTNTLTSIKIVGWWRVYWNPLFKVWLKFFIYKPSLISKMSQFNALPNTLVLFHSVWMKEFFKFKCWFISKPKFWSIGKISWFRFILQICWNSEQFIKCWYTGLPLSNNARVYNSFPDDDFVNWSKYRMK